MSEIEVAFTGRIGQPPQLRTSRAGKPWAAFTVAVGSGDNSQWVSVAAFGDDATAAAARLGKADRVYVEGRLTLNTWIDRDGVKRAGLQVAAMLVQSLGQIGRRRPARPKVSRAIGEAQRHWQAPPPATATGASGGDQKGDTP